MRRAKSRRPSAAIIKARNAAVRRRKTERNVAVAMGQIAAETIREHLVPGYTRGPVVDGDHSGDWYNRNRKEWRPPSDVVPPGTVQKIVKAEEPWDFRGMSPEDGERLAATLLPVVEKLNDEIRKLAAVVEVVKATGSIGAAREAMAVMKAEGNPLFLSDGTLNPEWVDDL